MRLGVKDDAIRKRIQRGTLEHEKGADGRVYVYLDSTQPHIQSSRGTAHDETKDVALDVLLEALQDEIRYLRGVIETRDKELETRAEEIRRRDLILSSLTQRVPEPEPSSEAAQDPVTSTNEGEGIVEPGGSPAGTRRSFWRRPTGS